MKHMKCLFLTIFLDCSWLWKQGLKSFLLALQVRLLNGMFTYCWELFDSLCWYPVFLITEFLLDKLRHLGWDGWVSSRSSMVVTHAVFGWSSLTPSLAGCHSRCPGLGLLLSVVGPDGTGSSLLVLLHMASAVPSSYSPCLRPSCYLCDGLGSTTMFWEAWCPPFNELVDSGESVNDRDCDEDRKSAAHPHIITDNRSPWCCVISSVLLFNPYMSYIFSGR